MFFFIGGVQPKTIALDDQPRMCTSCGLYQARLKRVDHYISIFFLPVLRIKKGEPFLRCESCGNLSGESGNEWAGSFDRQPTGTCRYCNGSLEPEFHFCPFCGRPT